eukprot:s2157_g17.t1
MKFAGAEVRKAPGKAAQATWQGNAAPDAINVLPNRRITGGGNEITETETKRSQNCIKHPALRACAPPAILPLGAVGVGMRWNPANFLSLSVSETGSKLLHSDSGETKLQDV